MLSIEYSASPSVFLWSCHDRWGASHCPATPTASLLLPLLCSPKGFTCSDAKDGHWCCPSTPVGKPDPSWEEPNSKRVRCACRRKRDPCYCSNDSPNPQQPPTCLPSKQRSAP